MTLLKSRADLRVLFAPDAQERQRIPICLTCGRYVDFNGVVEGYPGETTYAVYLVKHHGAEQKHTQDMGSTNWDYDDVEQAVKHMAWFDPMAVDGIGLGKRIENPGDHDGGG